jgi:hypothetical protein
MTAGVLLVACEDKKKETGEKEASSVTVKMPYAPIYSASFGLGNPDYATMIVQGSWKDWETNSLDNMKSWIADTIVAFHSDNKVAKGADSLIANWKRGRAKYTSVIDSIHAVIPVYSSDKKENWVLVWASEINTDTKGKTDTVELMETWRINKDGKADMLLQYDRHARKE